MTDKLDEHIEPEPETPGGSAYGASSAVDSESEPESESDADATREAESTEAESTEAESTEAESTEAENDGPPQYGVGPFSIREVALSGVWLVAFVVSFFSLSTVRFDSVWTSGIQWILTIGVPTVAVFLLLLRRLSPQGIRRVGSLGIDQFASVAFSVAAVLWLQILWETVAFAIESGVWARSWVMWVEFFAMLAGVFLTVFAPFIVPFDEDFRGRREIPAHRNARPIRPVVPRPVVPRPEAPAAPPPAGRDAAAYAPVPEHNAYDASPYGEPVYGAEPVEGAPGAWAPEATRETYEPVENDAYGHEAYGQQATAEHREARQHETAPIRYQAFWALAPEERDIVDDAGFPLFRIGPTAWALVIEDHGDRFVVRHEDGRVGVLNDIEGVTRG